MSQANAQPAQTYADLKHKIDPPQIRVADPVAEETEIVVKPPWDLAAYADGRRRWGEKHGVCPQFLPFAYLSVDLIQILSDIGELLNQSPPTKQRVSTSALYSASGFEGGGPDALPLNDICLLFGWWRGGKTASSGAYYCNPNYVHDHPDGVLLNRETYWDDDADEYVNERFEFALRAAQLGLAGPVLTPAFGMESGNGPRWWLTQRGFDWEAKVEEGRRMMAQTFKTINGWGYSYAEIAPAFGLARSTLTDRVRRHAADFDPPADPSYQVVPAGGGE